MKTIEIEVRRVKAQIGKGFGSDLEILVWKSGRPRAGALGGKAEPCPLMQLQPLSAALRVKPPVKRILGTNKE
jgi:hypothetical protein